MGQEKGKSWYKQPHARRLPKANTAERLLCEIANAKAEDSCGMAKVQGTMCEGKRTVCKGIAKGKYNATRNGRVQKRQGDGCHKGPFARREKAKAGNRRPCARGAA